MTHSTATYRPHIDGLRAVAVMVVVLFHAFPEIVPGGFIGVDVFFVISGFLISGITFDQVSDGSFTLSDFYARRVRRIVPALLLVTGITVAASWLVLLPSAFAHFGQQVLASSLFGANFFFWLQSGYFSPDASSFPLLHLWSLGVEEQFYIVWPLLALVLAKPRQWLVAILLIGGASFLLSVMLADHREFDFYLPATRAWELMAGAALAWLDSRVPAMKKLPISSFLFGIGLALITASSFLFDQTVQYPSWRAAVPVTGAALIVTAGAQSRFAAFVLSNRAAVFTGLISYPLYLWHWPVLVLAAAAKFMPLTPLERGAAVAIAYALAAATFRFVELPIRSKRAPRTHVVTLTAGLAAIAVVGAIITGADGFPNRFPADLLIADSERPAAWRVDECLLNLASQTQFVQSCVENRRPLVAVWGDSTAAALMPGMRDIQSRSPFGLAQLTASSCQPLLTGGPPSCEANNRRVLALIEQVHPDVVLLAGFGPLDEAEKEGWAATVAALKGIRTRVVVIGPAPLWKRGLPEQFLSYYISHRDRLPERSITQVKNLWDERSAKQFFTQQNVEYASAWDRLCNADGCLTRIDEKGLSALDGVHLSAIASIFLVNSINNDVALAPRVTDHSGKE
ncbi:acyltransferase family protein [Bradyrhizobium sp. AS23.2]|uniref:acyltransferase family protein n=1 Tax=Bradyrhizobium sp. AS23.2 TaxID=1680155 RepID=UPI00093FCBBC|nr:acyltransferase family protein [Bradyrhizobium sp. AS23.2]